MPNYVEIAVVHGYKTNICQIMFLCSVLHEIDKVCCIKLEQVVGGINLIIHIKNSKLHNNETHLSNNMVLVMQISKLIQINFAKLL